MKHLGSETGLQPMGLLTPDAKEDKKTNCSVFGATHPRNERGKLVALDMSPIMLTQEIADTARSESEKDQLA